MTSQSTSGGGGGHQTFQCARVPEDVREELAAALVTDGIDHLLNVALVHKYNSIKQSIIESHGLGVSMAGDFDKNTVFPLSCLPHSANRHHLAVSFPMWKRSRDGAEDEKIREYFDAVYGYGSGVTQRMITLLGVYEMIPSPHFQFEFLRYNEEDGKCADHEDVDIDDPDNVDWLVDDDYSEARVTLLRKRRCLRHMLEAFVSSTQEAISEVALKNIRCVANVTAGLNLVREGSWKIVGDKAMMDKFDLESPGCHDVYSNEKRHHRQRIMSNYLRMLHKQSVQFDKRVIEINEDVQRRHRETEERRLAILAAEQAEKDACAEMVNAIEQLEISPSATADDTKQQAEDDDDTEPAQEPEPEPEQEQSPPQQLGGGGNNNATQITANHFDLTIELARKIHERENDWKDDINGETVFNKGYCETVREMMQEIDCETPDNRIAGAKAAELTGIRDNADYCEMLSDPIPKALLNGKEWLQTNYDDQHFLKKGLCLDDDDENVVDDDDDWEFEFLTEKGGAFTRVMNRTNFGRNTTRPIVNQDVCVADRHDKAVAIVIYVPWICHPEDIIVQEGIEVTQSSRKSEWDGVDGMYKIITSFPSGTNSVIITKHLKSIRNMYSNLFEVHAIEFGNRRIFPLSSVDMVADKKMQHVVIGNERMDKDAEQTDVQIS